MDQKTIRFFNTLTGKPNYTLQKVMQPLIDAYPHYEPHPNEIGVMESHVYDQKCFHLKPFINSEINENTSIQYGFIANQKEVKNAYEQARINYKTKYFTEKDSRNYYRQYHDQLLVDFDGTLGYNVENYLKELEIQTIRTLIKQKQLWFYLTFVPNYLSDIDQNAPINQPTTYLFRDNSFATALAKCGTGYKVQVLGKDGLFTNDKTRYVHSYLLDPIDWQKYHKYLKNDCTFNPNIIDDTIITKSPTDAERKNNTIAHFLKKDRLNGLNYLTAPFYLKVKDNSPIAQIDLPEVQAALACLSPAQKQVMNNKMFKRVIYPYNLSEIEVNYHNEIKLNDAKAKLIVNQDTNLKNVTGFKPYQLKQLKQSNFSKQLQALTQSLEPTSTKQTKTIPYQDFHTITSANNYMYADLDNNDGELIKIINSSKKLNATIQKDFQNSFFVGYGLDCLSFVYPIFDHKKNNNFNIHKDDPNLTADTDYLYYQSWLMCSTMPLDEEYQLALTFLQDLTNEYHQKMQPTFNYHIEQIVWQGYNILLASPIVDYTDFQTNNNINKLTFLEYHLDYQQTKLTLNLTNAPDLGNIPKTIDTMNEYVKTITCFNKSEIEKYLVAQTIPLNLIKLDYNFVTKKTIYEQNEAKLINHDSDLIKQLKVIANRKE